MRTARQIIDSSQMMVNSLREHPMILMAFRDRLEAIETEIAAIYDEVMAEVRERDLGVYNPHHL